MDYLLQNDQRRYEISELKHCLAAYSSDRCFFILSPIYTLTDYVDLWGQFCIDTNCTDQTLYKEYMSRNVLLSFNDTKINNFQSVAKDLYDKFKEWCLRLKFKKDFNLYEINAVVIRGMDPVDTSKAIELTVFIPKIENSKIFTYVKDSVFTIETVDNVK
jgi:hypothetical protein